MAHHYEKDGKKFPSCTTIISDCTNKGGGLTQWAANCCVEWIRENGFLDQDLDYVVTEDQLNEARFAYKTVSDTALDVGSEVHNAIEKYLQGERYLLLKTEQAKKAFKAFQDWEKENNFVHIEGERTVYGDRWAGTLDEYCKLNDKLCVIDFKTSKPKNKKTGKGIYPEMRYQVAAYRSVMDDEIRRIAVWEGKKKNTVKLKDWYDLGDWMMEADRIENEYYNKHKIQGCGVLRLDKETGMPDWNDTSKTYEQDLKVFNAMVDLYFERHKLIAKRLRGE